MKTKINRLEVEVTEDIDSVESKVFIINIENGFYVENKPSTISHLKLLEELDRLTIGVVDVYEVYQEYKHNPEKIIELVRNNQPNLNLDNMEPKEMLLELSTDVLKTIKNQIAFSRS